MASRILVVGSGRMGSLRAGLIKANKRTQLAGVVDKKLDSAKSLANEHKVPAFESLGEGLDGAKDVNAVCISTDVMHEELIYESLDRGKHVMVEKPLAHGAAAIARIFNHARSSKNDLQIMTLWNRMRDPDYRHLMEQVRTADSNIRTIHLTSRDHPVPPPEAIANAGSIIEDFMVHDLHLILKLMSSKRDVDKTKLMATTASVIGDADTGMCVLRFADGSIATSTGSRFSPVGYQQMAEVCTNDKIIRIGGELDDMYFSFPQRYEIAYADEVDHFARVLQGEAKHDMVEEERINMLLARVVEGLELSNERQSVVELSEVPSGFVPYHDLVKVVSVGCGAFGMQVHMRNLAFRLNDPDSDRAVTSDLVGYVRRKSHAFDWVLEQSDARKGLRASESETSETDTSDSDAGVYEDVPQFCLRDNLTTLRQLPDFQSAIDDESVDAIVINTPDALHASMAQGALNAGKHVFCEKPLGYDRREVEAIVNTAQDRGLFLMTGFQRRFDTKFVQAKDTIQRHLARGSLESLHVVAYDPVPYDPNEHTPGFMVFNSMVHDVDTVVFCLWPFLLDARVVEAQAKGGGSSELRAVVEFDVADAVVKSSDEAKQKSSVIPVTFHYAKESPGEYVQQIHINPPPYQNRKGIYLTHPFYSYLRDASVSRACTYGHTTTDGMFECYEKPYEAEMAAFLEGASQMSRTAQQGSPLSIKVDVEMAAAQAALHEQYIFTHDLCAKIADAMPGPGAPRSRHYADEA